MNKKKNIPNKPKFNSYWIYAIILVFFASTYFVGGDGNTSASKKINISSFEKYLNKGEIKNEGTYDELIKLNENFRINAKRSVSFIDSIKIFSASSLS